MALWAVLGTAAAIIAASAVAAVVWLARFLGRMQEVAKLYSVIPDEEHNRAFKCVVPRRRARPPNSALGQSLPSIPAGHTIAGSTARTPLRCT